MSRRYLIAVLLSFLALTLAKAAPDVPDSSDVTPAVTKVAGRPKVPTARVGTPIDYSADGHARWTVMQHTEKKCRGVAIGQRPRTNGAQLAPEAFQDLSPPSLGAALGLATVGTPDEAGWCLSAGRRCVLKPTEGTQSGATPAYESWASAGWLVGVSPDAPHAARVLFDSGNDAAMDLTACLSRAIESAPDTGVWLVAGRVEFERAMGQGLARSPTRQPRNARFDPKDPTRSLLSPTESGADSALLVAAIAKDGTPTGATVLDRFLMEGDVFETGSHAGAKWLAHFALLDKPALPIDAAEPLDAIWNEPDDSERFPKPTTLRRAINGCRVARAVLSVWAIQDIAPYAFPKGPELIDPTTLDTSLIVDHHWAKPNPLVDHALFQQGRILLRRPVAEALVRVHGRLKEQGLRLKLHDGYRPFAISQTLYGQYPNATYLARPELGSRHNRGAAIDCTLTNAKGGDLEMPSAVLTFNKSSDRWRDSMSPVARRHLDQLTDAMAAEGFTTIKSEWWHYDAPDWHTYAVLNVPLAPTGAKPQPAARPQPTPKPRDTYRRPSVSASPTALPEQPDPTATASPILPMPLLIALWVGAFISLLLLLLLKPRVR